MTAVEVLKPGLLTTPQDAGRMDLTHLGIGRAGAFDAPALRLANALAGNPRDACALEITLFGPTLRFRRDAWIAVTGAPLPVRVDSDEQPMWSPLHLRSGQTLELGAAREGCRAYLAVRGGFDLAYVLGSRSLDVNAALGPFGHPLRAGDVLPVGDTSLVPASQGTPSRKWRLDARHWFDAAIPHTLRLTSGTHASRLDEDSREALFAREFRVGNASNRVGVRLQSTRLQLSTPFEMISEGCVAGTLQLPPSGEPIALGVEHPVSGGYPRIGQIAAVDLPRLAQCRPGDALRFTPCTAEAALRMLREREQRLRKLEIAILQRLRA
ncbi:MAG TPA: biotin-dependent carboxyltransferase family protein [Rhodanobacteraceae bacterium]|nr:biotin-dependent carboxyltransferase family protein [Rhodanobacteraceae bacterium]